MGHPTICDLTTLELANKIGIIDRVGEKFIFTQSSILEKYADLRTVYKGEERGIHIPNENIIDYFLRKKKSNLIHTEFIIKLLEQNKFIIRKEIDGCVNTMPFFEYCIFGLYHEEGHWVRSLSLTDEELSEEVENIRKENIERYEYSKELYYQYINNPANYHDFYTKSMFGSELGYLDNKTLTELEDTYRNLPWEKYADNYAINEIKENKKLIQSIKEPYYLLF